MKGDEGKPSDAVRVAAFMVVVALITGVIIAGRLSSVRPPREVCVVKLTVCAVDERVPPQNLAWAAHWWRSRGHDIRVVKDTTSCDVLVQVNPDLGARPGELAPAERYSRAAGLLEVAPNAAVEFYLHGFGHALGFGHPRFAPSGHVMNFRMPGQDDRGVEAVPCR